jgi:hypothetical protein
MAQGSAIGVGEVKRGECFTGGVKRRIVALRLLVIAYKPWVRYSFTQGEEPRLSASPSYLNMI